MQIMETIPHATLIQQQMILMLKLLMSVRIKLILLHNNYSNSLSHVNVPIYMYIAMQLQVNCYIRIYFNRAGRSVVYIDLWSLLGL